MHIINFNQITSVHDIALNFGVKEEVLQSIIDMEDQTVFYEKLDIPKKSKKIKGFRTVYKAEDPLCTLHKNILLMIEKNIEEKFDSFIHPACFGFVGGRGTYKNAKEHIGQKYLFQADIKNFFNSIPFKNIFSVFTKLGVNNTGAEALTKLCTINGVLQEGLHPSPMIANLFFYPIDIELNNLSKKFNCKYSRYADDLTFSSHQAIDKENILRELTDILKKYTLSLNEKKTRFSKYGQHQYVTGLSISNNDKPRIPKYMKKQLRQELHYASKYGYGSHFKKRNENFETGIKRLKGWIDYARGTESEFGETCLLKFKEI